MTWQPTERELKAMIEAPELVATKVCNVEPPPQAVALIKYLGEAFAKLEAGQVLSLQALPCGIVAVPVPAPKDDQEGDE